MNKFEGNPLENPSPHNQKMMENERRKIILGKRLRQSVGGIPSSPLKLIPLFAFFAVFGFGCWRLQDTVLSRLPKEIPGIAAQVLYYLVCGGIFIPLLLLLLQILGTPRYARRIEEGLMEAFKKGITYGRWPIYISRQRVKNTEYFKYTFFSKYVPISTWKDRQEEVALFLKGHIVGEIAYRQNEPQYIVVHAGPGAAHQAREAPADPEFRKGVEP